MKNIYLVSGAILFAMLTGCNQHAAQNPSSDVDMSKGTPSANQGTSLIEAPLDGRSNATEGLASNQSIKGEFVVPRGGVVESFDVQVGNYGNSSAGRLTVHVCQDEKCSDGSEDLAASKDNMYFKIPLTKSLMLVSGHAVKYVLTRSSGDNRLAVYTYPNSEPTSTITLPDGKVLPRTLKIGLELAK
ncbi:hypothetical protein ACO2Q2_13090 [Dyella sp. KRB-257]|uniref:hypothetical protein n=1 Tax=Dyella sp. KRB-257 TaxID=3400915 RepID=UPI003C0F359D